jgi:hypothetical protein
MELAKHGYEDMITNASPARRVVRRRWTSEHFSVGAGGVGPSRRRTAQCTYRMIAYVAFRRQQYDLYALRSCFVHFFIVAVVHVRIRSLLITCVASRPMRPCGIPPAEYPS